MTGRSRTCSKTVARIAAGTLAFFLTAGWAQSATVDGTIQVASTNEHRGAAPDLPDVVIWLEPAAGLAPPVVASTRARLLQKNKMFIPHVLTIPVGTAVDFPNADPIFHSAFSNFNGQLFDLSLYAPGTSKTVRFNRPGIVRVFCNIHPSMSAIILVLDTPYFTKAERDGHFRLSNVRSGNYELHIFDERATGKRGEGTPILIPEGDLEVEAPVQRISEEGYVASPHKNKYGLDYPPERDTDKYGGAPK